MARKAKTTTVAWCGFDLSTTGLALGVRGSRGEEAYVQAPMRGATRWQGQPAFHLKQTPKMMLDLLQQLQRDGWVFDGTALSFSVRQHDMVLLDGQGQLLMPALSWQCNAASDEVERLRTLAAEKSVGRIEERFILPKLMWALKQAPLLRRQLRHVMTTGDWVAYLLTGKMRLSTSDALSNGLLLQKSKRLAAAVIEKAKLRPSWFPRIVQSGALVGRVIAKSVDECDNSWLEVKKALAGAQVVAGLGDNHATGVGCGLQEDDFETIVVSAGTSGTVNRVAAPDWDLVGNAACFEFYKNRLLLMMLADCCKWYDRFVAQEAPTWAGRLNELNEKAGKADLDKVRRVLHDSGKEIVPPSWQQMSVGEKAASTQLSIMLELLLLVRQMLAEASASGAEVRNFVLTGGLSQSPFFQQAFYSGVKLLSPRAKVLISARKGPLRYQTAAYGALINAMRPTDPAAATKLCPTRAVARPDTATQAHLTYLLRACGLG